MSKKSLAVIINTTLTDNTQGKHTMPLYESHIQTIKDNYGEILKTTMPMETPRFTEFITFIRKKKKTVLGVNKNTRNVIDLLLSVKKCQDKLLSEKEKLDKLISNCLIDESDDSTKDDTSLESNENDDSDGDDNEDDSEVSSITSGLLSSLDLSPQNNHTQETPTRESSIEEVNISGDEKNAADDNDVGNPNPIVRHQPNHTKQWMDKVCNWIKVDNSTYRDDVVSYINGNKSLDDIINTIETTASSDSHINGKDYFIKVIKESLLYISPEINTYESGLLYAKKIGEILMGICECGNIYISVKDLTNLYQEIKGKTHLLWYIHNPYSEYKETQYKDLFGIFISYIYVGPKNQNRINMASWINSFKAVKDDTTVVKTEDELNVIIRKVDVISGFFDKQCADIYILIEKYLGPLITEEFKDNTQTRAKELIDEKTYLVENNIREVYHEKVDELQKYLDDEFKLLHENLKSFSIKDKKNGIYFKHNLDENDEQQNIRKKLVSLKRAILYSPWNEMKRMRNYYVQKLSDQRLYTYNHVYNLFDKWPFYDSSIKDNWTYFEDILLDFSNEEFQKKFFSEIIHICWHMDNRHIYNIAKCIELFIGELDDAQFKNKVNILKFVLYKLCDLESANKTREQKDLEYQLIGELSDILSPEQTNRVRKVLFSESQNNSGKTVAKGQHSLTVVNLKQEISHKEGLYEIKEKSHTKQYNNGNEHLVLNKDEICANDLLELNKEINNKDSIKESAYLNWLRHKRTYVRISSWNVSCTNNLEVPTTRAAYNEKLENIVAIACRSFSDIIALQELPHDLKLKEDEEKMSFDDIKDDLLKRMYDKTFHNWDMVWSTAFHESTSKVKTKKSEGKEVYAFLFNSDIVTYTSIESEVQKILDKRAKEKRLSRLPCFGKFKCDQLEIILCNMHLAPKLLDSKREIKDIGQIVLPALKQQFSNGDYQKVLFLGDFNMSYTTKGRFADPLPDYDTWLDFKNAQYGPCITGCFTNVLHNKCYDNIWMHYSLRHLRHFNKSFISTSTSDKGVFNMRSFSNFEDDFNFGEKSIIQFKKKYSDHNLVYVDLKNNEPMHWNTRPQVVIDEEVRR